jgi:hypothetical protein
MDEEWIWLWFRCLRLNKPYEEYCGAVNNNDKKTQAALEQSYKSIAAVYKDFGDVHAFKVLGGSNRKYWHAWLNEHRQLFITDTGLVSELIDQPVTKLDKNYLYIKVAIQHRKLDAVKAATSIIRDNYPENVAKYQLSHKVPSDKAIGTLRRQLTVWHKLNPINGKAVTQEALVNRIISGEVGRPAEWAWSPSKPGSRDEWRWSEEFQASEDNNIHSLVRQVQRYNSEAKNIIANTVHGVFPVKNPIE